MDKYIKCPRCEINYILEKQKLCDVCKAELKLAPDIYSEDDEDMVLCPICKTNYIFPDEDMCSSCRDNNAVAVEKEPDAESDEEWRSFLDDDKETPVAEGDADEISLSELHEKELEDDDEEENPDDEEYDDFGGKLDDYDDNFDDLDDEDEDEDDEDDDEDDKE